MSTAYDYLISTNGNVISDNSNNVWLKVVPLKISLFVWCMLLNRILTKDNLLKRGAINNNNCLCLGGCGVNEDRHNLFVKCDFLGRLWSLVVNLLAYEIVCHDFLHEH